MLDTIRAFHYRFSRQSTGLPVEFSTDAATFPGQCLDISASGIQATFEMQLQDGARGTITLYHSKGRCDFSAKVTRTSGVTVGLEFDNPSIQDQRKIQELLKI